MGQINLGRVVIGGLLAGLIINIGEFILNGLLLEEQIESLLTVVGGDNLALLPLELEA